MKQKKIHEAEIILPSRFRVFRNGAMLFAIISSVWTIWAEWNASRDSSEILNMALCYLLPVFIIGIRICLIRFQERKGRKRAMQKDIAYQILTSQSHCGEEFFEKGQELFLQCSRKLYWFQGIGFLLSQVYLLYAFLLRTGSVADEDFCTCIITLTILLFLSCKLYFEEYDNLNRYALKTLELDDCPLTTAFIYLTAIYRLSPDSSAFRFWIANAARCMLYAGWYQEALELLAEPELKKLSEGIMSGKYRVPEKLTRRLEKGQMLLEESHIRYILLRHMGQEEAADEEIAFQKRLMDRRHLLALGYTGIRTRMYHQIHGLEENHSEQAIGVIETYLEEASPKDEIPPLYWKLWNLYHRVGNFEQADHVLKKLLNRCPEYEAVRLAMEYDSCTWLPQKRKRSKAEIYNKVFYVVLVFFLIAIFVINTVFLLKNGVENRMERTIYCSIQK